MVRMLDTHNIKRYLLTHRGATAGKALKAWALPRFWVSIRSYKKQPVKKFWGRILGLAWLKFAVAPLSHISKYLHKSYSMYILVKKQKIKGKRKKEKGKRKKCLDFKLY